MLYSCKISRHPKAWVCVAKIIFLSIVVYGYLKTEKLNAGDYSSCTIVPAEQPPAE